MIGVIKGDTFMGFDTSLYLRLISQTPFATLTTIELGESENWILPLYSGGYA